MKKIIVGIFALLFCLAGLSAEHVKFKVAGSGLHYNQIRMINKTKYSNFNCEVFLLEEVDGKKYVKGSLGKFHLNEYNDQDTCSFVNSVNKGSDLGIEIPDNLKEVTCSISYVDNIVFETIEITLTNGSGPLKNEGATLGREF